MPGRIIGIFFACLMAIPILQIMADRELGVRRLEIWDGRFDSQIATSKQHRPSDPSLHLHRAQRTG